MKIELIQTDDQFLEMRGVWTTLYEKCAFSTPLQMWEWNYLYWKYFKGKKKLCILTLKDDNKLVAIFPLWARNQYGLNILEPIGTRGTDYNHLLLADAENETKIFECFLSWFISSTFDLINIEDIPESTPYLSKFLSISRSLNIACNINATYCPCYVINLPKSWAEYLESLTSRKRGDGLYYRRYVSRNFGEAELVNGTAQDLKQHFILHQKSRKLKGDVGAYGNPVNMRFMQNYAELMQEKNMLKLVFLSLCGVYSASILGVEDSFKRYDITVGYDPIYSKYRPGTLLYGYDIEDCINRGLNHYDLSRGPDQYKKSLGANQQNNMRLILSKVEKNIDSYLQKYIGYNKNRGYAPSEM